MMHVMTLNDRMNERTGMLGIQICSMDSPGIVIAWYRPSNSSPERLSRDNLLRLTWSFFQNII